MNISIISALLAELTSVHIGLIAAGVEIVLFVGIAIAVAQASKKSKKKPQDKPAKKAEKPAEKPAKKAEEKVEKPAPAEKPVEKVEEKPAEKVEEVKEEKQPAPAEEVVEEQPAEEVAPVEEVAEEPAEEPAPVEEVAPAPVAVTEEDEKDEPDEKEEEKEFDTSKRTVARIDGHIRYIIIKYNKSFTAKLIQSADGVKDYYSEIKNEILSYKNVKSRISWKYEAFNSGRTVLAKIAMRGKCVSLFLALDPKAYADSKYVIDDKSEVAAYEKTPLLYRIKNDRRLNYCKELIAAVMQANGLEKAEGYKQKNFAKEYPYEEIEPLVERKLVKVLTEEDAQSGDVFMPRNAVAANEVNELLNDEIAVALIEESDEVSDKTKSDIINIDTLSKNFEDGETVTLEEIKKRIPSIPKKTTCIKVLARGTLDKKLTVIADSFSVEAAKMILLTGGNVVKKKGN